MTNRTFIRALVVAGSAFVVAIAGTACETRNSAATAASVPGFLDVELPSHPPATAATLARGKQLYDVNCVQCHGEEGEGDGYGAPFLVPPPRDFTGGQFKFRTTAAGQLPTDDDLFRTISRGANGTGMPPWKYLLNDERALGARRLREDLRSAVLANPAR